MAYLNKLRAVIPGATPSRPPNEDELRGSGRSTALALMHLAAAIRAPGVAIHIRDHHEGRNSEAYLMGLMQRYAELMELQHLQFDPRRHTVTFTGLEWVG
jgi:hypothetical protein